MQHSESIDQLAPALVAAQAEMTNPPLDGTNPHYKSKFTTLAALINHTKPVLTSHGLALIQHPVGGEGFVGIGSMLVHTSGQWISEDFTMPLAKPDPQELGKVMTYLRRYADAAMTGVQGDEDTDAEPQRKPAAAPDASVTLDPRLDNLRKRFHAVAREVGDVERLHDRLKQANNLESFNDATPEMLERAIKAMESAKEERRAS